MKALAPLFAIVGIAMLGFGSHIALRGAEPEIPTGDRALEGEIISPSPIRGPAGEPFAYGEVRVTEAGGQSNPQDTHYRRTFGDARVKVRTPHGETTVTLPNPANWKVAPGLDDSIETQTLEGQLLIGDVDPESRISAPYEIRVRAVRTGDHVILDDDNGRIVRAFIGERAVLVSAREQTESLRWPAVGVIGVMGLASLFVAYRIATSKPEASV
jgi:hypothetical protein